MFTPRQGGWGGGLSSLPPGMGTSSRETFGPIWAIHSLRPREPTWYTKVGRGGGGRISSYCFALPVLFRRGTSVLRSTLLAVGIGLWATKTLLGEIVACGKRLVPRVCVCVGLWCSEPSSPPARERRRSLCSGVLIAAGLKLRAVCMERVALHVVGWSRLSCGALERLACGNGSASCSLAHPEC